MAKTIEINNYILKRLLGVVVIQVFIGAFFGLLILAAGGSFWEGFKIAILMIWAFALIMAVFTCFIKILDWCFDHKPTDIGPGR